jgi:hypothetical protein
MGVRWRASRVLLHLHVAEKKDSKAACMSTLVFHVKRASSTLAALTAGSGDAAARYLLASTPPSPICQALFDTLGRVTTSPKLINPSHRPNLSTVASCTHSSFAPLSSQLKLQPR